MSALIVLSGPPLPGRWALARALTRRLGARRFSVGTEPLPLAEIAHALASGDVIVDGELAGAAERRALFALSSGERLLVEWVGSRAAAEREIFHRYASRPRRVAEAEMARYLADATRRASAVRPLDDEALVQVGAGMPLGDQVLAVLSALSPRPPAPLTPERATVLIVEDDADERETIAEVLRELGYTVERAPNAAVALALVEAGGIDVVVSDQRMPGLSGVELTRELSAHHPEVRSILLTAYGDAITCDGALAAHVFTVLSKPVRVIDLQRALEDARS
jgi:CheY-like chemotaxis protein